jgi:hypothetical protein
MRLSVLVAVGLLLALGTCTTSPKFEVTAPGKSDARIQEEANICDKRVIGHADPYGIFVKCLNDFGDTVKFSDGRISPPTRNASGTPYTPMPPAPYTARLSGQPHDRAARENTGAPDTIAANAAESAAGSAEAAGQLIAKGIVQAGPGPNPGSFRIQFGINQLSYTNYANSRQFCEGAIGSVIPPLSVDCVGTALATPLVVLQKLAMIGKPDPGQHHIYLDGIERFWRPQSEPNDCWAAALETARRYLHYHDVSQEEMVDSARKICPRLENQKGGADAYQIATAITTLLKKYDQPLTSPHFCQGTRDVILSLAAGHPVIMLRSGHAVLVVGVDYTTDVARDDNGPIPVVEDVFILDPAGNGQVEKWTPLSFCKADAFLAY